MMFIVRVQLDGNPSWQDYDRLHQTMEAAGFSRTITGTAGTQMLPHAEYRGESNGSAEQVCNRAWAVATNVWSYGIQVLACTVTDWAARGLKSP